MLIAETNALGLNKTAGRHVYSLHYNRKGACQKQKVRFAMISESPLFLAPMDVTPRVVSNAHALRLAKTDQKCSVG